MDSGVASLLGPVRDTAVLCVEPYGIFKTQIGGVSSLYHSSNTKVIRRVSQPELI